MGIMSVGKLKKLLSRFDDDTLVSIQDNAIKNMTDNGRREIYGVELQTMGEVDEVDKLLINVMAGKRYGILD